MSRRTSITFSVTATVLFLYGLSNVVGVMPPDIRILWIPLLPSVLGVLIALPIWVAGLIRTARFYHLGWLAFLILCVWAMPVTVLLYSIAAPMDLQTASVHYD